jgi:dihydrofolate synthase/folylpolyglutamate synthase
LLAERLRRLKRGAETVVHAVVGVLGDKDIAGVLAPLVPEVHRWHCCALPDAMRGASANQIAGLLYNVAANQGAPAPSDCHLNPAAAFATALGASRPGEVILVFGSFYTVAPVLALLGNDAAPARGYNP